MGFFEYLKEKQIASFTKGFCKAFCKCFSLEINNYDLRVNTYSDYVRKFLSCRPRWKIIDKNIFQYYNGRQYSIINTDSLLDVVHDICFIEMNRFIVQDDDPNNIIGIILSQINIFFGIEENKWNEFVVKKTKEGWYVEGMFGQLKIQ